MTLSRATRFIVFLGFLVGILYAMNDVIEETMRCGYNPYCSPEPDKILHFAITGALAITCYWLLRRK